MRLYIDTSVYLALFDDHMPERVAATKAFFERINVNSDVELLVSDVLWRELLGDSRLKDTSKSHTDAEHVAMATFHNADYVVTYNMRHMLKKREKFNMVNKRDKMIKFAKPEDVSL